MYFYYLLLNIYFLLFNLLDIDFQVRYPKSYIFFISESHLSRTPIFSPIGHVNFALQCKHAILGKITKKRNTNNPKTIKNIINSTREKLKIKAGTDATIGKNKVAI